MLLTLFCWFALIFFIGASAKKFMDYAKKPMHGRQDLYPIPGEAPDRVKHGGSYYEDQKWFEKPREKNHIGEIIDMVEEMLFIKKLFIKQQKLWWISYALHLGIYCAIAMIFLVCAVVVLPVAGIVATLFSIGITLLGLSSSLLVCIGALGLLVKRIKDHEFRNYTTPQEYFNLAALFAGGFTGLCAWFSNGRSFGYVKHIIYSMLHLKPIKGLNSITKLHIFIFGALMIYIPVTKMSHYVGKYFAFHKVLWDNEPNLPGSKIEETIIEQASIKPTPDMQWSAPHYHK